MRRKLHYLNICNLPIQAPVIVPTYKKLTIEEPVTGRMIKYTCGLMETLAASRSSSFISFLWEGEEKFGYIQNMFEYRSQQFVSVACFDSILMGK